MHSEAEEEDAKDTTLANSISVVITGDVVAVLIIVEELPTAPFIYHLKQGEEKVKGRVCFNNSANLAAVDLTKGIVSVETSRRNFAV